MNLQIMTTEITHPQCVCNRFISNLIIYNPHISQMLKNINATNL